MQKISFFAFTNTLFFSFSFFHAMEKKEPSPLSIDDLPGYYKNVIEKLYKQPLIHNEPNKIPQKILPLDYNDAKIIDFFSIHAQSPINYFAKKNFFIDADGKDIFTGITLYVPSSNAVDSSETLEKKYEIIINKIKTNWFYSTLEEHSEIGFKKPKNTWLLFTKKTFLCEDTFIGYIASKLKLDFSTEAHHDSLPSYENQHKKTIYLWLKKDNFKKFQNVFKFNQFKPINLPVLQQQKSDQMCGYHVIKNALVGLKFSSNQWLNKSTKFPLTDTIDFNYLTDESYFNLLLEGTNKKDGWLNIIEIFRKKILIKNLLLKKLNAKLHEKGTLYEHYKKICRNVAVNCADQIVENPKIFLKNETSTTKKRLIDTINAQSNEKLKENLLKKENMELYLPSIEKLVLINKKEMKEEFKKCDNKNLEGDEIREILKSIHNPNLRNHFTIIDDLESVLSLDNFEEFLENYENAHKKLNDEKTPNYYHAFAINTKPSSNIGWRHWIMLAEQKLDSERKVFIANSHNTVIPNNEKLLEFIQKLNNPRIH